MAPVNFDKEIKKTLEKRQLQPSADAWSKLESQLDEQTSKSGTPRLWWLAVAASLVAIAWVVFNNDITDTANEPQQVETTTTPISVEELKENNILIEESITNQTDAVVEKRVDSKKSTPKNLKEVITKETPIQTETSIVAQTVIETDSETNLAEEKSLEQQQIEAVVAQMKAIDSTDHWSVDNEVDALLAEAQRNIKLEKLYSEALNAVDSNALLEEVEEDLDQSFRSKVFEALKASYKTVKTAVAERNN